MSDILIKNMKTPKNCEECPLNYYECALLDKSAEEIMMYYGGNSRHPDCPLIEVPTPHGDLIDRETAKKTVCRALEVNCKNLMNTAVPMLIDYALNNAPTIIESEGE